MKLSYLYLFIAILFTWIDPDVAPAATPVDKKFKVKKSNHTVSVGETKIKYRLYLPDLTEGTGKGIVFFSHGNKSTNKAHSIQALTLAKHGFISIALRLPNEHQWLTNGKRIAFVTTKLKNRYAKNTKTKVIFVGHSFGGTAVSFAEGRKPQVDGLILLDPALFHKRVLSELSKIKKPVYLLGADRRRFLAKGRKYFRRVLGTNLREVSVIGSTHNDAQYPSLDQLRKGRGQRNTKRQHQNSFLDLIVAAVKDIVEPQKGFWEAEVERKITSEKLFLHQNKPYVKSRGYALEQPAALEKLLLELH